VPPCNCAACRTPACVGEHISNCGAGVRGPSCRPYYPHEVWHPVAAQRARGPVVPGGTTCRARYCWQPPGTLPPMPYVLPPPPAAAPCHGRACFRHLRNGVYELDQRLCHAGGVATIFRMQLAAAIVHVVVIVLRQSVSNLGGHCSGTRWPHPAPHYGTTAVGQSPCLVPPLSRGQADSRAVPGSAVATQLLALSAN
jgi:hypothetical protein